MKNSPRLGHIFSRACALNQKAVLFAGLAEAQAMALRLERAMNVLQDEHPDRPVCIALVGGTGVGKSELFNALIGKTQASLSSQAQRPTTVLPHVAVSPAGRQSLAFLGEMGAVFVDHDLAGAALMDTPDVDSAVSDHLERTRRIISAADVVVYVGSPDKRANFKILEEVRAWSAQKRWFFALNKMDQIADQDKEAVLNDFAHRLEELGFALDDRALFAISAKNPQDGEFLRFKRTLFSFRAAEQVHALRCETMLNRLLYAMADDLTRPLEERLARVKAREDELNGRVRQVFASALADAQTTNIIRQAVREQAWRLAPGRVGGFLAMPVWLRSRLAFSGLAYQLARMASGGPSLVRMMQAGWFAAKAAWRGVLPVQALLQGFSAQQAGKLLEIALDGQRFLQDMGLASFDQGSGMHHAMQAENQQDEIVAPVWAKQLFSLLGLQGVFGKDAREGNGWSRALMQERLENAIEACAGQTVFKRIGRAQGVFGNLLPLLVFGHAAYRLGDAWLAGVWLPFEFYLSAVAVFLISLVPGYVLVSAALSRRGNALDVQALVASIEHPAETAGLFQVRTSLQDLLREMHSLKEQIQINIRVLDQELDPSSFGATLEQKEQRKKNGFNGSFHE